MSSANYHNLIKAINENDFDEVSKLINQFGLDYSPNLLEGGFRIMVYSIKRKQTNITKLLIEKNAKLTPMSKYKNLLLHLAIENNLIDIVKLLIDKKLSIYLEDKYKRTPLHNAVKARNIEIAKYIIRKGVNVNIFVTNTPLHIAVVNSDLKMIEFLLDNGANIHIKDNLGNLPLHYAIGVKNLEIILRLLNLDLKANIKNNSLDTPLHLAIQTNDLKVVQFFLTRTFVDIDSKNKQHQTPAYCAVAKNNLNILKLILEKKPNLNLEDDLGITPLILAIKIGNLDIIKLLVESGAEINSKSYPNKKEYLYSGYSPLHYAVESGDENIVRYLLKQRADVKYNAKFGIQPLHIAARKGHLNITKELLEHGADIECEPILKINGFAKLELDYNTTFQNNACKPEKWIFGYTPLHIAVLNSNIEVVKYFLANGADINHKNYYGETTMHIAIRKNPNVKIIQVLLKFGADVNTKNKEHLTALHVGILEQNKDLIQICIDCQADMNITNEQGLAPLTLAIKLRFIEIVKMLLENGALKRLDKNNHLESLRIAIATNCSDMLQLLIFYGVDLEVVNYLGNTIFDDKLQLNNINMVMCFLKYGFNDNFLFTKSLLFNSEEIYGDRFFTEIFFIEMLQLLVRKKYKSNLMKNMPDVLVNFERFVTLAGCSDPSTYTEIFMKIFETEIENMKIVIIPNTKISVYDLLDEDVNNLINYSYNKNILEYVKCKEFYDRFPTYKKIVYFNLIKAKRRREMLKLAYDIALESNYLSVLPQLVLNQIFSYLENKEFMNFLSTKYDPFDTRAYICRKLCDKQKLNGLLS